MEKSFKKATGIETMILMNSENVVEFPDGIYIIEIRSYYGQFSKLFNYSESADGILIPFRKTCNITGLEFKDGREFIQIVTSDKLPLDGFIPGIQQVGGWTLLASFTLK